MGYVPQIVYIEIFLKTLFEEIGQPQFYSIWHFATFLIQCCPIRIHTSHHLLVWWFLLMFQKPTAKRMCSEDTLYIPSGFCLRTIYFNSPWKQHFEKWGMPIIVFPIIVFPHGAMHRSRGYLATRTPVKASTLWKMIGKNLSRSERPWPWKVYHTYCGN